MKKITLVLTLLISLNAENIRLSLVDFIDLFKVKSNTTFILNDKLKDENIYIIYQKKLDDLNINDFEKILKSKSLKLLKFKNYYYIDYINEKYDNFVKLRSIKLKNNSYKYVKKIIDLYNSNQPSANKDNIKNEVKIVDYIETTNTIIFLCKDEDYFFLKNEISKNDEVLKTATLKITISETNYSDLISKGIKYKSLTKIIDSVNLKAYLNLFSASNESSLINSNKSFYSFIDFLSEKNITKIKASPFLTIKNNVNTTFSIVENIPYLTKSETIESSNKTESNTFTYKDVGLKIDIKPLILNNKIDFDLNISIEDIIDNNSLTPKTTKKTLNGSYTLYKNQILVLSGINKNTEYDTRVGIPLLKDIPVLKYLFSAKTKNNLKTTLLITIEYLNDEENAEKLE
ncbi:type II secretion system protein D [Campylobacter sp. RM5004]|uniref:type II secretion system protein GspD n=1 Tax=Campylobacter sp. RM5004 TaxID=1660078 RepID=UPI001EFA9D87|nr:type II and III secretion system protein [Campylobacter sp. RM5004]ULO01290.1 type II secretion system protein D [Campylobacter sp. RM5004]